MEAMEVSMDGLVSLGHVPNSRLRLVVTYLSRYLPFPNHLDVDRLLIIQGTGRYLPSSRLRQDSSNRIVSDSRINFTLIPGHFIVISFPWSIMSWITYTIVDKVPKDT
jgi:hypothetical protein